MILDYYLQDNDSKNEPRPDVVVNSKQRKYQRIKAQKRSRQDLRLLLFPQSVDHYEEKEHCGCWYVKQYNGNTQRWQVAKYTPSAFARYKQFKRSC